MKKLSFLSLFFVLLGAGLAFAVWLRVRSYEADATLAPAPVTASTSATAENSGNVGTQPHLDATIVDHPSATPRTSEEIAAVREQRYRELLNSAPPPTGTDATARINSPDSAQPPAPAPSLIQRVVKPIAEVLSAKRAAPPTPQAMKPNAPSAESAKTPSETKPESNRERDEDADITPPRLHSADFTPPQVADGEQTLLAVAVSDDLSGVHSVSGVIVSPSGAQQGFACQREGDTPRFTSRIGVPRDAAEGVWTVKYLTLRDNAGNTANLNAAQGALPPTATFRVVSAGSDSRGPTLKAVWLEQQSMSAGEKNQVFVQADDDKSGVALVSGVFVSPSKQARIGFGCRVTTANTFQCPVSPPGCVDCGAWQLEQVQLQDSANNMTTVRTDNALVGAVRLDLYGKDCDSTPPTITSLALAPSQVSNAEASVIRITAMATDDQCGVASLSGLALPPENVGGSRISFPFKPSSDGQTFVGDILVPKHAPNGIWTIAWIQALDKGHNLRAYTASDPVVARVTFRVE